MLKSIMSNLTALPPVTKLSNNIIRILGCNPGIMTLQGTNTYLVGSGKNRILIDTGEPGTAPAYIKILKEVLISENASIKYLLLTHWHRDHVGGVPAVKEMLSVNNFNDKGKSPKVFKLPRTADDITDPRIAEYYKIKEPPFGDFIELQKEQYIEVEGARLRVKHTPGHTTDHACFYLEDKNILFSGDCILGEGTAIFEDLHTYIFSLQKILEIKPHVIYPGHGPVINDPSERIQFYINHRIKRENDILRVLKESKGPISEIDIVQQLYKDKPREIWDIAAYNVNHHLTKLLKEDKVKGKVGHWTLNNHYTTSKM